MQLDYQKLGALLTRGGTILGTANRGRFSAKVGHGESRRLPQELIDGVKAGMKKLDIRGLVSIGGDGSLSIAQQLFEGGVPMVGVPKTIDNDLEGTAMTFGFDSAVACATDALDRLHTTAESHNRVMVLEVMGRYAGWIAIYAGVAGGARRDPHPRDPLRLRQHLRQDRGAREGGQAFHPDHRGRRGPREGAASSSPRPSRRPTARPGWAASARVGGRGNREAHRQGGPRLRAGASAARRQPHELRPRTLLDLRRRGGGIDRRRQVWRDGGLSGLAGDRGQDHRGDRAAEDRPARPEVSAARRGRWASALAIRLCQPSAPRSCFRCGSPPDRCGRT